MMYGWYGGDWGIVGWILMALVMIVFWGGLITIVLFLVRRSAPGQGTEPLRPTHHHAEQLLSERFARGEIDENEFTARRAALRRS